MGTYKGRIAIVINTNFIQLCARKSRQSQEGVSFFHISTFKTDRKEKAKTRPALKVRRC